MLSVLVTVMGKIMAKLVQDWFRVNWEYENNIRKCTSKHILLHSSPVFPDMSPLRELCLQRKESEQACRVLEDAWGHNHISKERWASLL